MFAREVLADPLKLEPRWLRVPAAVTYSGISRAKLFVLMAEGQIKSASITSAGKSRGIRVIDRLSIDKFLSSLTREAANK
jgi:hypothetical protein